MPATLSRLDHLVPLCEMSPNEPPTIPAGLTRDEWMLVKLAEIHGEQKAQTATMVSIVASQDQHKKDDEASFERIDNQLLQLRLQRSSDLQQELDDTKTEHRSSHNLSMTSQVAIIAACITLGQPLVSRLLDALAPLTHHLPS